jgi:hypothetical protein
MDVRCLAPRGAPEGEIRKRRDARPGSINEPFGAAGLRLIFTNGRLPENE